MNAWYRCNEAPSTLRITFLPSENRFWSPSVLHNEPLVLPTTSATRAVLTGAGAVWMYAHAAAMLTAAGMSSIDTKTPQRLGASDNITGSNCQLLTSKTACGLGALLHVKLRPHPPLSTAAIYELVNPSLHEIAICKPTELVLSGRASSEVYTRAAQIAVASGVEQITCWSARDGLVVVFDAHATKVGQQIGRPNWLAELMPQPTSPITIGITGDPNRGKSVFSTVLDWYRDQKGLDGWKLDCDGQAPTSPWFVSLLGSDAEERAQELRDDYKRPWTDPMEVNIAEQLKAARLVFPVLIADLPGGNHKASPPQRLPPGRERIFGEIDALVVIDREDAKSEHEWRRELQRYQLDGRIAAVLMSRDPRSPAPSLMIEDQHAYPQRGVVSGLDRARPTPELGAALVEGLDTLWPRLVDCARNNRYQ